MLKFVFACIAASFLLTGPLSAQEVFESDTVITNKIINGTSVCEKIKDGSYCGTEKWTITSQADGTRTLRSFLDWTGSGSQVNLVLRIDENFRPLDAFANVYSNGKFFGTGSYIVNGNTVNVNVNAPDGPFTEQVEMEENFSLLLHPISADGWHYGYYDHDAGGEQTGHICILGMVGRSVLCAQAPTPLEYVGKETITVPAGTFETDHYHFGKQADVWVMGPDRLMVQHEYRVNGTLFKLTELSEVTHD